MIIVRNNLPVHFIFFACVT